MSYSYFRSRRFTVPTVFMVVFLTLFLFFFSSGQRKYFALNRLMSQWDGQHYLSIARDGYQKYPCGWNTMYTCGNIGWFPMYPMAGKIVSWTGLNINHAMMVTSWLFLWLALLILYRLAEDQFSARAAMYSLLALLFFPTSFYFLLVFPYSMYLCLACGIFYLLHKARYNWLFLLSGMLTVSYPSGMVIALPLGYHLVRHWRELPKADRLKIVLAIAAVGGAMVLYFSYYWIKFDDFFLYNHFQAQPFYAHTPGFPLISLWNALTNLRPSDPVFIMLILVMGMLALFYYRRVPASHQVFLFAVLLFTPSFGSTDCYYRHIVVAFPIFIMIGAAVDRRWRRYLLAVYAVVCIVLAWQVYVKAFKMGTLM